MVIEMRYSKTAIIKLLKRQYDAYMDDAKQAVSESARKHYYARAAAIGTFYSVVKNKKNFKRFTEDIKLVDSSTCLWK